MDPPRRSFAALALLSLTGLLPACSLLPAVGAPAGTDETAAAANSTTTSTDGSPGPRLAYEATLQLPADAGDLRATLEATSGLISRADSPPPSRAALDRRIADDRQKIEAALRAVGHYAATVETTVDRDARPVKITIAVEPGPVYLIADLAMRPPAGATALPSGLPAADEYGLALGAPAASAEIVAAERRITTTLSERGHPLARVVDRRAVVDHALRSMSVTWTIDPGRESSFGASEIRGLSKVKEALVRRRIKWREGQRFDTRQVEATRKALVETKLFSSVRVTPADRASEDGRLPLVIAVDESEQRSIGGGASYSTSTGFGTELFWEHRDLFDNGERLRVSGTFAEQALGAEAEFRRPFFLRDDQEFVALLKLAEEKPPAYDNRYLRLRAGLERKIGSQWTVGISAQYEREEVQAHGETNRYHLAGLPTFVRWDRSDNLLDPTRGTRTTVTAVPYVGLEDTALGFLSVRIDQTGYWRLDDAARYVLAANASIGTMVGASRGQIPAPQRFYAGGGGSVRGYGFQMAGPVDAVGDPLGGKSLFSAGGELRIKVTETIGIVPFLEMGTVYDSTLPSLSEEMFIGAGIGARYYTSFGPVRLDIGTPLRRRKGIDDLIQLYVSLGQAF